MLENLNSPQLEAVTNTDGPLLVLAGAGTGKTKVLTSRIINIIATDLASPYQILAVTFTNKAAAEMKKRIGDVIGDQVNNLWVGTFHSVAARILRRNPEAVGLRSDFTIIDDDDQTRLLKQILNDFNIDTKQFPAKNYLGKISRMKDRLITPQSLEAKGDDMAMPKLKEVYEMYQSRLKSMNAADFGDLLVHNLTLFKTNPEVLSYYQDRFRYVLVDEYQDTNNAQYQWLLFLAAGHKNICCVGDDDQSIYSWRGANIANILRFEKDFTDAKVIRLEQNYRSTSRILKAADSVIKNNKERHGKTLWTDAGQGEKVKVFSFPDDRTEASTIARTIKNFIAAKRFHPTQIAILVRAGYQTRSFEEAFIHNAITYKVIGGMKFYERMEIRDSIAYLRLCANLSDDLALSRIINTPKRGVGDAAVASLYERSKLEGIPIFSVIEKAIEDGSLKGKARDALKILFGQIQSVNARVATESLSDLARQLLNSVGYISMWKSENTLEAQGRVENIEEFINSLADFSSMTEFLEYVSLVEARDEKNVQDAVSVMTVHAAKGLEFDLVFVPGLEDGIFPSGKSVDERNGLEEERRLMYVAITRAKKELVLSYAKTRYIFGDVQMQAPSRFIKELPEAEIIFEEVSGWQQSSSGSSQYSSNSQYGAQKSFSDFSIDRSKYQQPAFSNKQTFTKSFSSQPASKYSAYAKKPESKVEDGMSGRRVFHQKFGYGKVLNADGNKLEIAFEKTGIKTVMKDFITAA